MKAKVAYLTSFLILIWIALKFSLKKIRLPYVWDEVNQEPIEIFRAVYDPRDNVWSIKQERKNAY